MLFIWIAIFAYLLFAVNAVIDKFLLHEERLDHPAVYAFAIGILSQLVIFLAPFGFRLPRSGMIWLALTAGALFTFALLTFFAALKRDEASRVVPVQGGFVPFFTLILAFILLGERLEADSLIAFVLLVSGSILIFGFEQFKSRTPLPLLAAFLFALSFTLIKGVFNELEFINGFIWTRFGMGIGALLLLSSGSARRAVAGIFTRKKSGQKQMIGWFLAGQVIGTLGAVSQTLAISLGSVTLVNALQGTQFAFLLVLTSVISWKYPRVLKERISRAVLTQKVIAIVLISLGVVILAF